jgi:hypothetical protein
VSLKKGQSESAPKENVLTRSQRSSCKIFSAMTQAAEELMMEKLMNDGVDEYGQVDEEEGRKEVVLLNSSKSFLSNTSVICVICFLVMIELLKYSL